MYFASAKRAVAEAFVRRHGPLCLWWYGIRDKPLASATFVQKPVPRWPMWYVSADKVARGRGRLSADTDHIGCGSMRYGRGDKRPRLELLVCPQPRTTARRGACGTCLRTNPLVRDPVCPETRTSMPHVVRVCGQTSGREGRSLCTDRSSPPDKKENNSETRPADIRTKGITNTSGHTRP